MNWESERDRIASAYARYDSEPSEQAKRDSSNPGNRAIQQERDRLMVRLLRRSGLHPPGMARVVDVGCGSGAVLEGLVALGFSPGRMAGCDILPDRIDSARTRLPSGIRLDVNQIDSLPYESQSFDLAITFTLFSSILDLRLAKRLADEVRRVVRPQGFVLWYDSRYRNPRNPNVRAIGRLQIGDLFPESQMELHTVTLVPPLARRLGRITPVVYPLFSLLRPLRVRFMALIELP